MANKNKTQKLTIKIDCGNAAFEDAGIQEVATLLREVAQRLEDGDDNGSIMDTNGNRVGEFAYTGPR